jgi:hypothetical protein
MKQLRQPADFDYTVVTVTNQVVSPRLPARVHGALAR